MIIDWLVGLAAAWLLAGLTYCVYTGVQNTKQAVLKKVNLPIISDAEPAVSIRMLQLSDLHMEHISLSPDELFEQLQNETFDLIVLTGDFLDRAKNIPKLKQYLEMFGRLHPPCGIYAVFGNHDHVLKGKRFESLKRAIDEAGIRVLQNEYVTVTVGSERLTLIGLDNFGTGHADIDAAFSNAPLDTTRIVLSHDPNAIYALREHSFDYMVSGHFHGGQIHWPKPYHLFKMGKLARENIIRGLHYIDEIPFYINEGLGQTGFNLRWNSYPEITLHQLTCKENVSAKGTVVTEKVIGEAG